MLGAVESCRFVIVTSLMASCNNSATDTTCRSEFLSIKAAKYV
jgi:hypothetical protein